jgi:hypothetical protein
VDLTTPEGAMTVILDIDHAGDSATERAMRYLTATPQVLLNGQQISPERAAEILLRWEQDDDEAG